MEKVIYEYIYKCEIGYTFKKQICLDENKKTFFNFVVNDNFGDNLLLTSFDKDFKDSTLNNEIKEYLLKQIRGLIYVKTLFLTIRNKGEKATIEILKDGIKFDGKVFKLQNNDYHSLQYQILDYISTLKNNVK